MRAPSRLLKHEQLVVLMVDSKRNVLRTDEASVAFLQLGPLRIPVPDHPALTTQDTSQDFSDRNPTHELQ